MTYSGSLAVSTLDAPLAVLRCQTLDGAIDRPDLYSVVCLFDRSLPLETLQGTSATLEIVGGSESTSITAYVEHVQREHIALDSYRYTFTLVNPLYRLSYSQRARVWMDKPLADVIQDIIAPLGDSIIVRWLSPPPVTPTPFWMQLHETDLDYFTRLLGMAGLHYTTRYDNTITQLLIADSLLLLSSGSPRTLQYTELSGMPRLPDSAWNLMVTDRLVGNTELEITTDAVGLCPGQIVTLTGQPEPQYNQAYRIIEARLSLDNTQEAIFQTQLLLIAIEAELPLSFTLPRVHETLLARIDAADDSSALLDESGSYRLAWAFDTVNKTPGQRSAPVPFLQTLGGNQSGISHPHRKGTLVTVAFMEGDVTRPVIVGAAPTPQSPSLVNNTNAMEFIVQSHQGHSLSLDDHPAHTSITLRSAKGDSQLQLDKNATGDIELNTKGDMRLSSARDITRHTEGPYQQTVKEGVSITSGGLFSSISQQGDIHLHGSGAFTDTAQGDINFHAKQSLSVQAAERMEINAGQAINILNQTGNTQLQANTVSLHTAAGMNIQGDKSVTLQVGNHALQATEAGNLILSAKHITFSAKQNIHLANTTSSINSSSASSLGNAQINQTVMQQTFSNTPPFTARKPKKIITPTVIPSATAAPVADEGSSSGTTQNTSANTSVVCSDTPTPAATAILGTCAYYQFRHDDFVKRHQGCSHAVPPDYYLNYGFKYCERFSISLYPQLSLQGKVWLTKARKNLQVDLESILTQNKTIEENNDAFNKAAFATHPNAYMRAGFANLPVEDWIKIGWTPDYSTWVKPEAREQAEDISRKLKPYCEKLRSTQQGNAYYELLTGQIDQGTKDIVCRAIIGIYD